MVEHHKLSKSHSLGFKGAEMSAARSHEMHAGKSATCVCVYHGVKAIGSWQQSISVEEVDLEAKLAH